MSGATGAMAQAPSVVMDVAPKAALASPNLTPSGITEEMNPSLSSGLEQTSAVVGRCERLLLCANTTTNYNVTTYSSCQ